MPGSTTELAGHKVDQRSCRLQFRTYRFWNDVRNRGGRVLGWIDVVSVVLGDVRLVELLNPVGLLVDERVDFLRMRPVNERTNELMNKWREGCGRRKGPVRGWHIVDIGRRMSGKTERRTFGRSVRYPVFRLVLLQRVNLSDVTRFGDTYVENQTEEGALQVEFGLHFPLVPVGVQVVVVVVVVLVLGREEEEGSVASDVSKSRPEHHLYSNWRILLSHIWKWSLQ